MVQKNEMPFRTLLNIPVVLVTAWTACELCNTNGSQGSPYLCMATVETGGVTEDYIHLRWRHTVHICEWTPIIKVTW